MEKYSSMDDNELISLLRQGEEQIVEYLMEKYKPIVKKRARTMFLAGGDHEDLLQEGMMGLFKAILEFDPEKGASFPTFASLCISRQMLSAIEASQRKKHQPLNSSISFGELEISGGEAVTSSDQNPESIVLDQERADDLMMEISSVLSPYENRVLKAYLQGLDYIQISEVLGKTPKSVDNALQRIRTKVQAIRK
ncbi:MAG: sigma-70 family RNA polymerase sigma factor [Lachnospiraceae bacterium]|nr:sigma-70 family RNA polymerase sigma factor [Lachnospiraceae bacterium]